MHPPLLSLSLHSPVLPQYVFRSPAWMRFFPLFLTRPQRQQNDLSFYNILQEIRIGKISENSKNLILAKIETDAENVVDDFYNTTHIVGTRQTASEINRLFCESTRRVTSP